MACCLYFFLRRRLPWPYAMAGMLLPALTAAGRYSYEARPYALVLAFAAVALVSWQAAAEGRRRALSLVGLGGALAAALACHPMAATLALPFLAGELARTARSRRVDLAVWCAFACATPILLALWQIETADRAAKYWRFSGTLQGHFAGTYLEMLRPAIAPLGCVLLLALVLLLREGRAAGRSQGMPSHEAAALWGFVLIPAAAVPLSVLAGHYFLRYSIACAIGLAGVSAVLLHWMGLRNRTAGRVAVAAVVAWFVIGQVYPGARRPDAGLKEVNTSEEIRPFLERMPSDAPVVICRGTSFVELEHYASPELASRLYYLTEPAVAAAIDGDVLFEVKEPVLAKVFPFRAHFEDYHAFIATHKRFYVIDPIRNIAKQYFEGHLSLGYRKMNDEFGYWEARPR